MRHRPDALMLFAAGFGTRMGALTAKQPKPMVPIAGKPLIDYTLELAQQCGFSQILANVHYLPDSLVAHLTPLGVQTIVESPDILDTGGGLKNALGDLGSDPVVTSNTDAVWFGPNPFEVALKAWNPDLMDALLVCIPIPNCVGHKGEGDFLSAPNGTLTRGAGDVVYGGIQILKTDLLKTVSKKAFSLNLVWDRMLGGGRLFGVRYPGKWADVGSPEGIVFAESLLGGHNV